jgi:hypothetical protein
LVKDGNSLRDGLVSSVGLLTAPETNNQLYTDHVIPLPNATSAL